MDVATFIAWIDADQSGNSTVADFYEQRFRDEFKPAFAAWLATKPLTNRAAPETPFVTPQYRLAAQTAAQRQEARAAGSSNESKDANERANDYMLATVLFACALFFAGISSKLQTEGARTWVLGLGWVLFVGTVIYLVTLPAHV